MLQTKEKRRLYKGEEKDARGYHLRWPAHQVQNRQLQRQTRRHTPTSRLINNTHIVFHRFTIHCCRPLAVVVGGYCGVPHGRLIMQP